MRLYALLRRRRNVYGFLSRPIQDNLLMRILENATHIPSAGFTQDFDFIVVKDEKVRKKLADAAREEEYVTRGAMPGFIANAPIIVVPCANKARFEAGYGRPGEEHSRLPWWLIDAGFASWTLILSAFEEGLAASFMGAIDDDKVAEILGLPKDSSVVPLAVIPIGHKDPMEEPLWKMNPRLREKFPKGPPRRPLTEVIHWDSW